MPGRKECILVLAAACFACLAAAPSLAQTAPGGLSYVLNKDRSRILFSIGHFYVSSTEGRFGSFDGKLDFDPQAPEQGRVIVHIAPGSISTDNAARDEHLRSADFFDAAQFPMAIFTSTSLARNSGKTGTLSGTLSLHGVTRPVTLTVTLASPGLGGDKELFSATGTLKRSDYGMTNYLGVIGDDVKLDIEAEFDRER